MTSYVSPVILFSPLCIYSFIWKLSFCPLLSVVPVNSVCMPSSLQYSWISSPSLSHLIAYLLERVLDFVSCHSSCCLQSDISSFQITNHCIMVEKGIVLVISQGFKDILLNLHLLLILLIVLAWWKVLSCINFKTFLTTYLLGCCVFLFPSITHTEFPHYLFLSFKSSQNQNSSKW